MFFGILLRPLRALRIGRPRLSGDPVAHLSHERPPLRLHWRRGPDGHPRGHWDGEACKRGRRGH